MQDDRTLAAERRGLDAEQHVVDGLYARVDELRDEVARRLAEVRLEGPSGSPQNRSERDAFATLYEDRIAQLDAVEDRLCFGRLDMSDGERFYVGRIGLSDEDHAPLLTDWRAPAAQAFYSATAANPGGVVNRRHLTTRGRTVVAVEDDVLDVERLHEAGLDEGLAGEGALLAALGARRTGRMGDIVATIQAEQDDVIRAPMTGALVVQGGPGTGKTAVALHRAAFLLYHHREQLERRGVLLIGPSRDFLRYIDHVLPSLGETGAVSRAHLYRAPQQQKKREHGNGFEIHLTGPEYRGVDAGAVGQADGQRDRDVHGQVPATEIPQGVAEEGSGTVEHHRCGHHQAEPAKETDEFG